MTKMSNQSHKVRIATTKGREIFEIPVDMSFDQFLSAISKMAKVPKKYLKLLSGFPPKVIDFDKSVAARDCVAVNETIVVKSEAPAVYEKIQKAQASSSSAAAVSASTKEARKRSNEGNSNSSISKSNRSGSRKMSKLGGDGRTLSGKVVSSSTVSTSASSSRRRVPPRAQISLGSSESDVATTLLGALNSGGGGNKVGRFLRGAMRGAVGKSYEASRAQVRVSAVESNRFKFLETEGGSFTLNGLTKTFQVEYSKGIEGRGDYSEVVEIIGIDTLKAVITQVFLADDGDDELENDEASSSREMLRPINMAQLSPRVFWSLAYHFEESSTSSSLKKLLPDLDWSFLSTRTKTLSEKAKENLRQERVRNGDIPDKNDFKASKAGFSAIESVEEAMIETYERQHNSANEAKKQLSRNRLADAALLRVSMRKESDSYDDEIGKNWVFSTPSEFDVDELKECIQANKLSAKIDITKIIQKLVDLRIRNWRELANADSELLAKAISTESILPNSMLFLIEEWIEQAQIRSLDEIMMEIVDLNEDIVIALREIKVGTPKDLSLWESIPSQLMENIIETKLLNDTHVNIVDAKRWCSRAKILMQMDRLQWLEWFASDV